jgi:AcrR family transcriptional regulator
VPTSPKSSRRVPRGRAPHRRDENARLAVLHAADDLLAERGFTGVTIEGIAARAGVAKQTIYRWWPSKVDILLDTVLDDTSRDLAVPYRGSAVETMRRYMLALVRLLTKDPAGRVLLSLIGQSQHDSDTAHLFDERYLKPRRGAEREILKRGVESGELSDDLDLDSVLDCLLGPVFFRALTGQRIPRRFVDELISRNLAPHQRVRDCDVIN